MSLDGYNLFKSSYKYRKPQVESPIIQLGHWTTWNECKCPSFLTNEINSDHLRTLMRSQLRQRKFTLNQRSGGWKCHCSITSRILRRAPQTFRKEMNFVQQRWYPLRFHDECRRRDEWTLFLLRVRMKRMNGARKMLNTKPITIPERFLF